MEYSTFSGKKTNHLTQPMFLGESVGIARYDENRLSIFNKLTELQQSYFWRPSEVDTLKDVSDFKGLTDNEKEIFLNNISYQTMMDTVQGRAPSVTLLPLVSLPELETWIDTWTFSETIHSRSYTHIIQTVMLDSHSVLDQIMSNKVILERAGSITRYYDEVYRLGSIKNLLGYGTHQIGSETVEVTKRTILEALYRCLISINALEAVRFYVSFACSFSFAQRNANPVMEGVASIMKLIAKDESLHLSGTESMINTFRFHEGALCQEIAEDLKDEAARIFLEVADQEKQWAKYLFRNGSMIGLSEQILCQYVEYLTADRMAAIGLEAPFDGAHVLTDPMPWMAGWLGKESVQKAPQETTEVEYMAGNIETSYDSSNFAKDFDF